MLESCGGRGLHKHISKNKVSISAGDLQALFLIVERYRVSEEQSDSAGHQNVLETLGSGGKILIVLLSRLTLPLSLQTASVSLLV